MNPGGLAAECCCHGTAPLGGFVCLPHSTVGSWGQDLNDLCWFPSSSHRARPRILAECICSMSGSMAVINQWRLSHSARCSNCTDRPQNQITLSPYSFVEKFSLVVPFLPNAECSGRTQGPRIYLYLFSGCISHFLSPERGRGSKSITDAPTEELFVLGL